MTGTVPDSLMISVIHCVRYQFENLLTAVPHAHYCHTHSVCLPACLSVCLSVCLFVSTWLAYVYLSLLGSPIMVTGTFVPTYFRSQERKYHRWNFRSLVLSLPGTFAPGYFRSQELSLPGTFVPWNFCPCTNTRNV